MYFSNSQASRLLPMPAWPTTVTSRGLPLAGGGVEQLLAAGGAPRRGRRTAARGRLARARRRAGPTTRSARQAGTGAALPLRSCSPASSKAIASAWPRWRAPRRRAPSPARPRTGGATAVLTRSPATMPWPVAPTVTAASPVRTPARRLESARSSPSARTASTRSSAARTARSASSSWAIGAPQTAITASPMNFSTVPP